MSSELLFKAELAEQTERYDDMAKFMTQYIEGQGAVTKEARNLLSVAFKNCIGASRSAWRIIRSKEQNSGPSDALDEYKSRVKKEFLAIYNQVMGLLDNHLLDFKNDSISAETKVFFHKMKGDYTRYKAEIVAPDEMDEVAKVSLEAYNKAQDIATEELSPTHPTRLGLSLNFSVFHYEIAKNNTEACRIAKEAFDSAIANLDSVSETDYKDSTLIMQLLRDNITLWTTDAETQEEDTGEDQ